MHPDGCSYGGVGRPSVRARPYVDGHALAMVAARALERAVMSGSVQAVGWLSMIGRLSARTLYLFSRARLPNPLSSPEPGVVAASLSVQGLLDSVLLRLLVTSVRLPIVLTRTS